MNPSDCDLLGFEMHYGAVARLSIEKLSKRKKESMREGSRRKTGHL
jgi:hypothetical protein